MDGLRNLVDQPAAPHMGDNPWKPLAVSQARNPLAPLAAAAVNMH
ncbi:MAG TPA: hypothetical protein VES62_05945 [Thermoleophilaceae bacterium]|nr:hypothetical protein [Thermoleophilaceae bacterium]